MVFFVNCEVSSIWHFCIFGDSNPKKTVPEVCKSPTK